jgi:hypothetical protein
MSILWDIFYSWHIDWCLGNQVLFYILLSIDIPIEQKIF